MSGRRTSVLTLAVALLVGTADRAAAQESFQTPLNNGTTNDEGSAKGSGARAGADFVFMPGIRAIGPTFKDLSPVTAGGFGSYCAVLLPRSVVPAPRRMLVVCDEKGRMHLVAAADVPAPASVVTVAQEPFQAPINNGTANGEGAIARAGDDDVYVDVGLCFGPAIRITGRPTKDMSWVAPGGFGSYCAVLLPRSVVSAPRRILTVSDEGTRMRLVAAEDVLAPLPAGTDAQLPKAPSEHKQEFRFGGAFGVLWGPHRESSTDDSPRAPLPTPASTAVTLPLVPPPGVVDPFADYNPPGTVSQVAPNPLLGTWYREVPATGLQVVATFTSDELKVRVTSPVDGRMVTATVTAHYALTPDGLMFGAVTGADVEAKNGPKASSSDGDLMKLTLVAQMVADAPFSCRAKVTSAGLMVSGLKFGLPMDRSESEQLQLAFGGLFKIAKDGKVPALARVKPKAYSVQVVPPEAAAGVRIGNVIGSATGKPVTNSLPPTMPGPVGSTQLADAASFGPPFLSKIPYLNEMHKNVGPAPTAPVAPPVRPGVSEDSTKQMAQDAFGQLLQQSGVVRPAAGAALPDGRYLEHYPQYFSPDPAHPMPRELANEDAVRPAVKAGPVGTWYRDIAGKQCVVKVTPDHLTLTVHDAQEIDGKVSTASLVITADYHLNRDGITATGLITSVDVNFEGDFPADDSKPFFEMLSELQQALEDKPFALTFRTYGDALVIGSVRMPRTSDRMDVQPAGYMGGRYKIAGDKLPKPKPVKVSSEPKAFVPNGVALPPSGPSYGPTPGTPGGPLLPEPGGYRDPLLPPPPLPASNGDLLPPQQVPSAPPARVVPSGGTDSWAPAASQPAKPVPPMPQPVPPGEVRPVGAANAARSKETAKPVIDSDAQKLLPPRSDDLRQIFNEWRRFWFDDRPSHLTPERIHGGIY